MKGEGGAGAVYFGHRRSREGWVSFETHPRLARTKARLYERCLPCLTDLLEQLRRNPTRVNLTHAWDCWKVVAVVRDEAEAMELLARFAETFPAEYCYGKLGGKRPGRDTAALVFHTEDAGRRDDLERMLQEVVEACFPGRRVFVSRGCADPYEAVLGPWPGWTRTCPVRHPERVPAVVARLREMLYGK